MRISSSDRGRRRRPSVAVAVAVAAALHEEEEVPAGRGAGGGEEGGRLQGKAAREQSRAECGRSVCALLLLLAGRLGVDEHCRQAAAAQQEVGGGRGGGVVNAGGEDEEEEGKDVALFVGRLAWAQTEKAATPLHLPLSSQSLPASLSLCGCGTGRLTCHAAGGGGC